MVIDMNEQELNTVAQLRAFLAGTQEVHFEPIGKDSKRYEFIVAVVKRLGYGRLRRPEKGIVMRYLEGTTGYSRAQLKRLVRRAHAGKTLVKRYTAPEKGFARKFTPADVALLAQTDALHGTLFGTGHHGAPAPAGELVADCGLEPLDSLARLIDALRVLFERDVLRGVRQLELGDPAPVRRAPGGLAVVAHVVA